MKILATMVGGVFLAAGVAVAIIHYVVETSSGMEFATLAIAAALLIVGWTLFDWGRGVSKGWRSGGPKGNGQGQP